MKTWPLDPGWYWFYGWAFKSDQRQGRVPELHIVRVSMGAVKPIYVCNGHFMFRDEAGEGLWFPAVLPEVTPEMLGAMGE